MGDGTERRDAAERPVGFFDSGIGGTCILNAFRRLCPNEATVYIADSENCPYGNKPPEEIIRLSEANVRKLLKQNCKMIVVACNTATAAAIDYLREKYPQVPFVGIEPALKPAALRSKTGVVGVLATAGTFHGRLYNETKARFAKNVTVLAVQADEFVTLVERAGLGGLGRLGSLEGLGRLERLGRLEGLGRLGRLGSLEGLEGLGSLGGLDGLEVERIVRKKIEPLLKAGADKIVLGCTHFPHLKPVIERVCAGRAEVIDPSEAVARQAKRVLEAWAKRQET